MGEILEIPCDWIQRFLPVTLSSFKFPYAMYYYSTTAIF
jgi:hypothetical protein